VCDGSTALCGDFICLVYSKCLPVPGRASAPVSHGLTFSTLKLQHPEADTVLVVASAAACACAAAAAAAAAVCCTQVTGTPGFRAPEVMDVGWGKAADTYAFGIIAWQLLTGGLSVYLLTSVAAVCGGCTACLRFAGEACSCSFAQLHPSAHPQPPTRESSTPRQQLLLLCCVCSRLSAHSQAASRRPVQATRCSCCCCSCCCCCYCCCCSLATFSQQARSPSLMTESGACTCPTPTCCASL
jgi:serine/threonine protein kinase